MRCFPMGYRENYEAWLKDFACDAATVADLNAIANDEKEIKNVYICFHHTFRQTPK